MIDAAGSLALAMLERLVQRRKLGGTMLVEARLPDDVARERNVLVNPAHPDAVRIVISEPEPPASHSRLFGIRAPR